MAIRFDSQVAAGRTRAILRGPLALTRNCEMGFCKLRRLAFSLPPLLQSDIHNWELEVSLVNTVKYKV